MPIYMKVPGVEGTGTGKYKGWIELQSAQLGVNRRMVSPTGQGANKEASVPPVSEIVVTKSVDVASPDLFRLALSGEGKKVIIDFVKDDDPSQMYLSLELENTLISNYSTGGHAGDNYSRPMEFLSLNFTKVTYSAKPVQSSTDPKHVKDRAGWNLATGGATATK